jgi:hypothetical protein
MIALFVTVCSVYWACPVVTSLDSAWSVPLARSIVRGSLRLDSYNWLVDRSGQRYQVEVIDGHTYSYYPPGVSILAAPLIATRPDDFRLYYHQEKWAASILTAVTVALVFGMLAEVVSLPWALGLALAFAFGTSAWSMTSRGLWSQTGTMLTTSAALWLLLAARRRTFLAGLAGLPLAFGFLIRPTAAIPAVVLAVYVAVYHRRQLPLFLAACAAVLIPFVLVNLHNVGHPLTSYYTGNKLGQIDDKGRLPDPATAFVGLLFSPGRGLFVFSPFLLLAPVGLWVRRRLPHAGALVAFAAVVAALHLITNSFWPCWWGGWSFGPRLMADVLPCLMLSMAPLAALRPRRIVPVLAVLIAVSAAIHFQGATNPDCMSWNGKPDVDRNQQRLWDWSDLQFMQP